MTNPNHESKTQIGQDGAPSAWLHSTVYNSLMLAQQPPHEDGLHQTAVAELESLSTTPGFMTSLMVSTKSIKNVVLISYPLLFAVGIIFVIIILLVWLIVIERFPPLFFIPLYVYNQHTSVT